MKSWISTSLVKCTDVVVAVGGVVLCSCFLFPVSEASSIAVVSFCNEIPDKISNEVPVPQ
jgi:hypothetical protein